MLNYTQPLNGDRDFDVRLNVSSYGIRNMTFRPIVMQWQFNTSECNNTYYNVYGLKNIMSSAYMYYLDGNNFLSVEYKMNGTTNYCNDGVGQVNLYKRLGGTTVSLIPFTTPYFKLNTTYTAMLNLSDYNSTNYKLEVWLNGTLLGSSTNITKTEISQLLPNGDFRLEVAGTKTWYDNFVLYDYGFSYNIINPTSSTQTGDFNINITLNLTTGIHYKDLVIYKDGVLVSAYSANNAGTLGDFGTVYPTSDTINTKFTLGTNTLGTYTYNFTITDGNSKAYVSPIYTFNIVNAGKNSFCSNVTSHYEDFFTSMIIIFTLIAVIIIVMLLLSIFGSVDGGEFNTDIIENIIEIVPLKIIFSSILGLTVLVWIIITIFGLLC